MINLDLPPITRQDSRINIYQQEIIKLQLENDKQARTIVSLTIFIMVIIVLLTVYPLILHEIDTCIPVPDVVTPTSLSSTPST